MEFCAAERTKTPVGDGKGAKEKAEERGTLHLIDSKASDSGAHEDEDDIQPKWFQTSVGTIGNHSVFTTFVAGFIFSDLTGYADLDLPPLMGAVYLTLTTLAAAIFLGSSLLSIFTLIAIDRTYSIAYNKPTAKVKAMLDAFGAYEPETRPRPAKYTPSVHIFKSTQMRKHLAVAVAPALVLYMAGLVIKVSGGELNLSMVLCCGAFTIVMLPALFEARKVMRFLTIS